MLVKKEFTILTQGIQHWVPRTHPPYPPEYLQQIVELARAGRSPIELAREFEPSEQTIRDWIKQAEIDTDPVRFTTQCIRHRVKCALHFVTQCIHPVTNELGRDDWVTILDDIQATTCSTLMLNDFCYHAFTISLRLDHYQLFDM